MARYSVTTVAALVSLLFALVPALPVSAQSRGELTDCRGRSCSAEDLEKALFPEPKPRMRGVTPQQTQRPPSVALNVFFEFNSDKILTEHHGDLNELGKILAQRSGYRFRIEGHTDSVGSERYNRSLSQRRVR